MKNVTVSQLRNHLPEFIRLANRGGAIRITSRGREVARIIPAQSAHADARRKLNLWAKTAKLGDITSPILTDWDVLK